MPGEPRLRIDRVQGLVTEAITRLCGVFMMDAALFLSKSDPHRYGSLVMELAKDFNNGVSVRVTDQKDEE